MRKKDTKLAAIRAMEAQLKVASPAEAGRLCKLIAELKDLLLDG